MELEKVDYAKQYFKDLFNEDLQDIDVDFVLDIHMILRASNGMMISEKFVDELYANKDDEEIMEKIEKITKVTYQFFKTSDKSADEIYAESVEKIKRSKLNASSK